MVIFGFFVILFLFFVRVIGIDGFFFVFIGIFFVVFVVNLWVVGVWVEFNVVGLLEVLVIFVSIIWLLILLFDVRFDVLLDNVDELFFVKK